jgi:hypothetical protein
MMKRGDDFDLAAEYSMNDDIVEQLQPMPGTEGASGTARPASELIPLTTITESN